MNVPRLILPRERKTQGDQLNPDRPNKRKISLDRGVRRPPVYVTGSFSAQAGLCGQERWNSRIAATVAS